MTEIKYHSHIETNSPIILAGWPGMGAVATQAVDYIRRKLNMKLFAEIEPHASTPPNTVIVSQGISYFPKKSRVFLFYSKEYDLIVCEAEEQFTGNAALKVVQNLLEITEKVNVSRIYTGAAFVRHMHYKEDPEIYVVSNSKKLRDWLVREKELNILNQGQISGLNGSILGFAYEKNIEGACFLATIPIYSINFPNPKASMAIVKIWQKLIGFNLDFMDLHIAISKADKTFEIIEEQLKKMTLGDHTDEQIESIDENEEFPQTENAPVPYDIIEGIEELFTKAQKDKTIAHKLKEDLDRWNLFKEYEDRFLDLFRDSH
ncbi:MAG TPA: PAC2 family protein [Candidatus Eremiobacteraeota bacterium]|nr:MAG: PAC2 family protein [bacterium ADurb.Bin363]HPZ10330.1 PAC2 family protein [Candidatus Eremiobacteraeota bacterium]